MRTAITGANGFIGTHLTHRLGGEGHELVLISRHSRGAVVSNDLSDMLSLTELFRGCKAVAHCAGINREIGNQTYQRVHVEGARVGPVVSEDVDGGQPDAQAERPATSTTQQP